MTPKQALGEGSSSLRSWSSIPLRHSHTCRMASASATSTVWPFRAPSIFAWSRSALSLCFARRMSVSAICRGMFRDSVFSTGMGLDQRMVVRCSANMRMQWSAVESARRFVRLVGTQPPTTNTYSPSSMAPKCIRLLGISPEMGG